ncbi:MAG: hypothetical protein CMJ32_06840 [Phycisphaerae bacterium]|nr:hypothetical protein [Phycisphaerae bacterium]
MFHWFSALGLGEFIAYLRSMPLASMSLPGWVFHSLPHALWLFSGCLALHAIWRSDSFRQEQFWVALIAAIAISGELGQAAGFVQGTFDLVDLVLIVSAFAIVQCYIVTDRFLKHPRRNWA